MYSYVREEKEEGEGEEGEKEEETEKWRKDERGGMQLSMNSLAGDTLVVTCILDIR